MRTIIRIEMATHDDVYEVTYKDTIKIESSGKGFDILVNNEMVENCSSKRFANQVAKSYVIDDDLIISGYGKHSGRKFWQLPKKLQLGILRNNI